MKTHNSTKRMLALLLSTLLLSACGEVENGQTDTTSSDTTVDTSGTVDTETVDAGPRLDVPTDSLDGYTFRVLTRDTDHHIKEVYAAELNGEVVNDAVYTRNMKVEDTFDAKLEAVEITEDPESAMSDYFRKTVQAGEDAFDVALMHTVMAGAMSLEGMARNWHDIAYVDFSKPWWNSVIAEELDFQGKLYLAASDYCISAIDYTWAMLYNRAMGETLGLGELYDTVDEGKWTFDKFSEFASAAVMDVNGDGKMDENDRYGYTTHWNSATLNWSFAFDVRYIVKNDEGVPTLLPQSEKMADIMTKLYDFYYNGNRTLYITDQLVSKLGYPSHDLAVAGTFEKNQTLFAALRIYVIDNLRNMEDPFAIIPFPKYDEAQTGYYTHVDGHAPLMILPKTLQQTDNAGIVMEALAYYSHELVVPAVYDIVLQNKYARDESSAHMLDLILDGRVYTFGYIYDDYKGMQWTIREMLQTKKEDYASYYASKLGSAEKQLQKIIDSYESMEE